MLEERGLGIIYPLLPRAARPDMRLQIDAVLPEAAALDRQTRTPTVLEIVEFRLQEDHQPQGPRLAQAPITQETPQPLDGGL